MNIGVLKEIKEDEHRIAITPSGASNLIARGHNVFVQSGCGIHADAADNAYLAVGANVVETAREVSENVDILAKVAPPQPEEFHIFREVQALFSFIHSETQRPLIDMLLEKRITGIALENIQTEDGRFPILEPMAIIAGQQAVMIGNQYLQSHQGGIGVSLVRFPGLKPASVVVLGAGLAGEAAARTAAALGSNVLLADTSVDRIRALAPLLPANITPIHGNTQDVRHAIKTSDLIINALPPQDSVYAFIPNEMVSKMKKGAVIVDATGVPDGEVESIDHLAPLSDPAWEVEGIIHVAATDVQSAVAATASCALENAHLPWLMNLADQGVVRALQSSPSMQRGITSFNGTLCWHKAGTMQEMPWKTPEEVIAPRSR